MDVAGAHEGGARRWLQELHGYAQRHPDALQVVGLGQSLSPRWMLRRELQLRAETGRVVAANNVSFLAAGAERVVLLRNALHFPHPREERKLSPAGLAEVTAQACVVRFAVRRADLVVVPSSSMLDRVCAHLPRLSSEMRVRPHPVTPRPWTPRVPGRIVCPVIPNPYKQLHLLLKDLVSAADLVRSPACPVEILATLTEQEVRAAGLTGSVVPLGRLAPDSLDATLGSATAIYYPTALESFGYPLAEARVNGQPVLGLDTPHNREVAGSALVPYGPSLRSMADALVQALTAEPAPDVGITPDRYFSELLKVA